MARANARLQALEGRKRGRACETDAGRGGAVEGQRPAGGRPLPGGGTCGRSGARGRQRGPAPPCRDCTRRGSGRHAFGRRSRAATSGPSSRSRTPPSAGCQPPPPPRPVRASRVEGRERVPQRQSALSSAMKARSASLPEKKEDIVFQRRLAILPPGGPINYLAGVLGTAYPSQVRAARGRSPASREGADQQPSLGGVSGSAGAGGKGAPGVLLPAQPPRGSYLGW